MEEKKKNRSLKTWWLRKVDHIKMAGPGILGVMRNWRYASIWALCALLFAYLLTFFKDGAGRSSLLFSSLPFKDKTWIIMDIFPNILANFTSLFGWFIILASVLQGLAISLLVFNYKHKQEDLSAETSASGFGLLFSFLALGCPSCGVTMLTPVVLTVLGTGALAAVGIISRVFVVLVFILLGYAVIKLGSLAYITLLAKKSKERYAKIN